jgi:hypothetical protein
MSVVLTGNPAHVTTPLSATVIAMADNGSGAIRVQTGAPHLFGTDDTVRLYAIGLDVDIQKQIDVIDATHFDMRGSTYAGTATGVATDLSLTPQILVPSDGDSFSAQLSGLLSAFQGLLDRTQSIQARLAAALTAPPVTIDFFPQFDESILGAYDGASYDFTTDKWLVLGHNLSSHAQAVVTSRSIDEVGWTNANGSAVIGAASGASLYGVVRGYEPSDSFANVYAGVIDAGSATVAKGDTVAGTWTPGATVLATAAVAIDLATINGTIVAGVGASTSGDSQVWVTNSATALPWTAEVGSTVPVPRWLVATNTLVGQPGSRMVAIPCVLGGGGGILRWYETGDGITFTPRVVNTLLASSERPSALCIVTNASGAKMWLLATYDGTNAHLYRAIDTFPLEWSPLSSNVGLAGLHLTDMRAVGAVVVAVSEDLTGYNRAIYSVDSGRTWQTAAVAIAAGGHMRIAASDTQFLIMGPVSLAPSSKVANNGIVGNS